MRCPTARFRVSKALSPTTQSTAQHGRTEAYPAAPVPQFDMLGGVTRRTRTGDGMLHLVAHLVDYDVNRIVIFNANNERRLLRLNTLPVEKESHRID